MSPTAPTAPQDTIRDQLLLCLYWQRQTGAFKTATTLSKAIGRKLSSVSSQLLKLCHQGQLERKRGRGGFGYRWKGKK